MRAGALPLATTQAAPERTRRRRSVAALHWQCSNAHPLGGWAVQQRHQPKLGLAFAARRAGAASAWARCRRSTYPPRLAPHLMPCGLRGAPQRCSRGDHSMEAPPTPHAPSQSRVPGATWPASGAKGHICPDVLGRQARRNPRAWRPGDGPPDGLAVRRGGAASILPRPVPQVGTPPAPPDRVRGCLSASAGTAPRLHAGLQARNGRSRRTNQISLGPPARRPVTAGAKLPREGRMPAPDALTAAPVSPSHRWAADLRAGPARALAGRGAQSPQSPGTPRQSRGHLLPLPAAPAAPPPSSVLLLHKAHPCLPAAPPCSTDHTPAAPHGVCSAGRRAAAPGQRPAHTS